MTNIAQNPFVKIAIICAAIGSTFWTNQKVAAQSPGTFSSITVTGSGSTGNVSGMSATAGSNTRTLGSWFTLLAPLASPSFSGTVSVPVLNLANSTLVPTNDYNTAGSAKTLIIGTVGTVAVPTTDPSAVGIFQKTSNYNTAGLNSTLYSSHVKYGSGGANEASAVFGEAIDEGGGSQSSVIGVRGHAQLNHGQFGSAVGGTFYSTIAGSVSSIQNVVGIETAIQNEFAAAPVKYSQQTMTAAILAGNTGSFVSDAALITNPFVSKAFRNGVLITPNSVSDAAFRSLATTSYGLDLGDGSQTSAAIRAPNAFAQKAPTIDTRDAASTEIGAGGNALLGVGVGGLFLVTNTTSQAVAVYAGDAATGLVRLGGSPSWVNPTTAPLNGQTSVAFDTATPAGIKIFNGYNTSQSFKVIALTSR